MIRITALAIALFPSIAFAGVGGVFVDCRPSCDGSGTFCYHMPTPSTPMFWTREETVLHLAFHTEHTITNATTKFITRFLGPREDVDVPLPEGTTQIIFCGGLNRDPNFGEVAQ